MSDELNMKYVRGFNHGFILAQYRSELTNKIIANNNITNQYFDGFRMGAALFREQDKTNSRSLELKKLKQRERGNNEIER